MLMELKDAFFFLLDIFKGELPAQDLYLLLFILIVTPIAESIQEKRKHSSKGKSTLLIYLKWIPITFLASSIYLTGFYFITNLFTKSFLTAEVFQMQENIRSMAIMSLTMLSIATLIIAIWRLYPFFIGKRTILILIINALVIAIGVYVINGTWYETIIVPLWFYGLIGVVNTGLISLILLDEKEKFKSNQSDNTRSRTIL
ncbi:hypothetical protein [Peribacillus sp. NPDC097295]|uniref:hypothetical protein n=1 Tax=Peribacillus sp. NPDC097295 TaxID=3364402 RepID=UPI003820317C